MGFFSKFEGKMEDTFEGAAGKMQKSPISPVQIMKKAEKQMRREKVVSAGKQYAPTLYTVLVNPDDDQRLFGFYPTLAGECETRLAATASADGLAMDGHPLVRFIVDDGLKHGKFDIIAEVVSAPIVEQLRAEEMQRYGMGGAKPAPVPQAAAYGNPAYAQQRSAQPRPMQVPPIQQPQAANPFTPNAGGDYGQQIFGEGIPAAQPVQPQPAAKPPLPYVPENEIDYSLNYGEYTFDSKNFEDYRKADESDQEQAAAAPNVTGEEKADSSPDAPPRMRGFTELHPTRTRRSTSKPRRPASKTLIAQSMPPFLSPNIPPSNTDMPPKAWERIPHRILPTPRWAWACSRATHMPTHSRASLTGHIPTCISRPRRRLRPHTAPHPTRLHSRPEPPKQTPYPMQEPCALTLSTSHQIVHMTWPQVESSSAAKPATTSS